MRALNNESFVRYHEFAIDAVWKKKYGSTNKSYLLMDYVEGPSLLDFFSNVLINGKQKLGQNSDKLMGDPYCRYLFHKIAMAIHKLH